jgi:hypothetical protein
VHFEESGAYRFLEVGRFEEEIERMNVEESAGLGKTEEEGQHGINVHITMGKERGESAGRDRPPFLSMGISTRNPVYERRVDPSTLALSLSSHRYSYINTTGSCVHHYMSKDRPRLRQAGE